MGNGALPTTRERLREARYWRVLNAPRLLLGVEWTLAVLNLTLTGCAVVAFKTVWIVAPAILIHYLLKIPTRRDPAMARVYLRYARQADHYAPWPKATQRRNLRPVGYGRGMLC